MGAGWIAQGADTPAPAPGATVASPSATIAPANPWKAVGPDTPSVPSLVRGHQDPNAHPIENSRSLYQSVKETLFGHEPEPGDKDQHYTTGILPSIGESLKGDDSATANWATKGPEWATLARAYPHLIGAQVDNLKAGVQEKVGASQTQDAERAVAALNVLPQVAARIPGTDEGAKIDQIAQDPNVKKVAIKLGIDPRQFAGDWAQYSGLSAEEQRDVMSRAAATMESGKANSTAARSSRAQAWADERVWQPSDLKGGAIDDPWSLKSLAFKTALAIPGIATTAAATVGGGLAGGPGGAAAAGGAVGMAIFAPQAYADAANKVDSQASRLLDRAQEVDANAPPGQQRALSEQSQALRQQAADLVASRDKIASTAGFLNGLAANVGNVPVLGVLARTPAGKAILDRMVGSTIAQTMGGRVAGTAVASGIGLTLQTAIQQAVDTGIVHEQTSLKDALTDMAQAGVLGTILGAGAGGLHEMTPGAIRARAAERQGRDDADAEALRARYQGAGERMGMPPTEPGETYPGYRWNEAAKRYEPTAPSETNPRLTGTNGPSDATQGGPGATTGPSGETPTGAAAARAAYQAKTDALAKAAAGAEKRSDVSLQPEEEGWSVHVKGQPVARFDTVEAAREAMAQARKVVGTAPAQATSSSSPSDAGGQSGTVPNSAQSAAKPTTFTDIPAAGESGPRVPESELERTQPVQAERRSQTALRQKVADMTPEQLKAALLTHETTNIPNKRAYEDSAKQPSQVFADVDSLKWLNDNAGHDSGDQLLKAVAQAMHEESGGNAYHLSGDEFALQGASHAETAATMARVHQRLANAELTFEHPDGRTITLRGIGVSHGTGSSLEEAERNVAGAKAGREALGERASRGAQPPNASVRAREAGLPAGGGTSAGPQVLGQKVAKPAVPTEAQAAAGNYFKPGVEWHGLPIKVENTKGQFRRYFDAKTGKPGKRQMRADYGYFPGTKGNDEDGVDVMMGPHPEAKNAYVIDQLDHTGKSFDEHKVQVGVRNEAEARAQYLSHYPKDWKGLGGITELSPEQLKRWLKEGDLTQPIDPESVPVPKTARGAGPNNQHDSLLEYLARHPRGLDSAEAVSQGIDPADMALKAAHVGIKRAFRKGGMTFDEAAEHLHEAGYRVANRQGAYDPNVLLDKISDELRGRKHYSVHNESESERETAPDWKTPLTDEQLRKLSTDQAVKRLEQLRAEQERLEREIERAGLGGDDDLERSRSDLEDIPFQRTDKYRENGPVRQAVIDELMAIRKEAKAATGSTVDLNLTREGDLHVSLMAVPKDARSQGIGTTLMHQALAVADKHGLRMLLSPAHRGEVHGTTSKTRLVAFYKRFGFVENKGKNKDFTLSDTMYRLPKTGYDINTTKDPNAEPRVREQQDLFGDKVSVQNQIKRLEAELDRKRNSGQESLETGRPDDLFSQARGQMELPADFGEGKFEEMEPIEVWQLDKESRQKYLEEAKAAGNKEAAKVAQFIIEREAAQDKELQAARDRAHPVTEHGRALLESLEKKGKTTYEVREPARSGTKAKDLRTAGQLDIFANAGAPLPATRAAELAQSVKLVRAGEFRSGLNQVKTWEDAAHIMAPLRKNAQENMTALVLDAAGKPLAVIRHSVGMVDAASVEPWSLAGSITQVPGAAQVYFAHNHPSGIVQQSTQDEMMTRRLHGLLEGTGIEAKGMIVVAPGNKYATYFHPARGELEQPITLARRRGTVPMLERRFGRMRAGGEIQRGTSPAIARRMVGQLISDGTKSGVMLLDQRHQRVGVVPMSPAEMAQLRTGNVATGAGRLLRAAAEANANRFIIWGPNLAAAQNIAVFANAVGIRPLDVFTYPLGGKLLDGSSLVSAAEKGKVPTTDTFLQRPFVAPAGWEEATGRTSKTMSAPEVRSAVEKVLAGFKIKPTVVIAKDLAELQGHTDTDLSFHLAGYEPGEITAFLRPSTREIYLIADQFHTPADVAATLAHEYVTHFGLREAFGDKGYQAILDGVNEAMPAEVRTRGQREYGDAYNHFNPQHRARAAEEALAYYNQRYQADQSIPARIKRWLDKLHGMIRDWIRNVLGLPKKFDELFVKRTLADLEAFLRRGNRPRAEGRGPESEPAFAGRQDTFFSGLAKAVDAAKRDKGTGAEWEATLKNMPGVKAEEMQWTGLKDWLEGRGRVSKAEVAEYVAAHRVQVGEVMHGGPPPPASAEAIRTWLVNNGDVDNLSAEDMEHLSDVADKAVDGSLDAIAELESFGMPMNLFAAKAGPVEIVERIRALGYTVEEDHSGEGVLEEIHNPDEELTDAQYKLNYEKAKELLEQLNTGSASPPKYADRAEPGGENYRELLLTLSPQGELASTLSTRKQVFEKWAPKIAEVDDLISAYLHGDDGIRRAYNLHDLQERRTQFSDMRDEEAAGRAREIQGGELFRSSHWNERNVLAHVRFDDRTGPNGEKVLHLAEVQSDWHQAGRRHGYFRPEEWGQGTGTKERVPDAPFKTTWPELAMKRMLRYAAEKGYDALSWDTGSTNAERYNMQQVADKIVIDQHEPGTFDLIATKGNRTVIESRNLSDERLAQYVGKDMAQKAAQANGLSTFTGDDLKVGGAGMRGFYDGILPKAVDKLVRKFGSSVEPGTITGTEIDKHYVGPSYTVKELEAILKRMPTATRADQNQVQEMRDVIGMMSHSRYEFRVAMSEAASEPLMQNLGGKLHGEMAATPAHTVKITPALRDSVMGGQPMFLKRRKGSSGTPPPAPKKGAYEMARRAIAAIPNSEFSLSLRRIVDPAGVSDPARATALVTRAALGELARNSEEALQNLERFSKLFDQLGTKDRYDFIDSMETGAKQADARLQPAADALRAILDDWRERIRGLGIGALDNFIENYFPHIWADDAKAKKIFGQIFGRRPLKGPASFLKERTIPTTREGLEAGLTPISTNPLVLAFAKLREMQRFYTGVKLMQRFKDEGLAKFLPAAKMRPDDWAEIEDAVGRVRQWSETEQGFIERGHYIMPVDAARVINNHLSSSALRNFLPAQIFRVLSNAANALQLGFSAFHLGFTTLDAVISKNALAIERLAHGEPLKAAQAFLEASTGIGGAAMNLRRGYQLFKAYANLSGATPEMRRIVQGLEAGGGRIKMDNYYMAAKGLSPFKGIGFATLAHDVKASLTQPYGKVQALTQTLGSFPQQYAMRLWRDLQEIWELEPFKILPIMSALEVAGRMTRASTSIIMEHIVPLQKLGVFSDLAADHIRRNPLEDPVAFAGAMQKIWDSVDNRLGEMVYDNVFWNRTFKEVNHMMVRAVGWNLGTIRELGGAPIDVVKLLDYMARGAPAELEAPPLGKTAQARLDYEAQKSKLQRIAEKIGHKIPYTLALIGTTMLFGAVLTRLFTGKDPEETKDYFFPPTGRLTKYGTKERISMPSYTKDLYEYGTQPMTTLINKANPLFGIMHGIYANEDFFGNAIRDTDAPKTTQIWQSLAYGARQVQPFSLQGTKQFVGAGEMDEKGQILSTMPYVGFGPAPARVTSPEQMDAYQHEEDEKRYIKGLRMRLKQARDKDDKQAIGELTDELHRAMLKARETEAKIRQNKVKAAEAQKKISGLIDGKSRSDAVAALNQAGLPAVARLWESLPEHPRPRVAESLEAFA